MTIDYLIVGQGVAGSVLAWTLDQRGCSVVLTNDPATPAASAVAAGIVNPLTGRKLVQTWKAAELFPFLHQFYSGIEAELGVHFFHPGTIYRPYRSEAEKKNYLTYTADPAIRSYIDPSINDERYAPYIENPFGGLTVGQAGWVDLTEFGRLIKGYFIRKNQYYEGRVPADEVLLTESSVIWNGVRFGKIIFCDGVQATENPLFNWLPFSPVKGQLLTAMIDNYPVTSIVNQGIFVMPVRPGLIRIGATYSWDDLDWQTTPDARTFLEEKARALLKIPFEVVGQQAGIRPSSKDRRPFVGIHPDQPAVGIFGGMGTKGVSLSPYLAEQFARYLLDGEEIDAETNITRCVSL